MDIHRTGPAPAAPSATLHVGHRLLSVHHAFLVGIILKGLNGLLEIAGGILAFMVAPPALHQFVANLTRHELLQDPHDFVATHLLRLAAAFSTSSQVFLGLYLLSHGIVKLLLVISLWQRRLWAYPAAIIVFVLFIIYQMYRYTFTHAISLLLLTALDFIVIALTILEYRNLRHDIIRRTGATTRPDSPIA